MFRMKRNSAIKFTMISLQEQGAETVLDPMGPIQQYKFDHYFSSFFFGPTATQSFVFENIILFLKAIVCFDNRL